VSTSLLLDKYFHYAMELIMAVKKVLQYRQLEILQGFGMAYINKHISLLWCILTLTILITIVRVRLSLALTIPFYCITNNTGTFAIKNSVIMRDVVALQK
jgi:hypothetical protein